MADFGEVWDRIEHHAGKTFHQIRGGEFTYVIRGDYLLPDRTNQHIPRSDFEKAFKLVPLNNTTALQSLRGPSYIYAVLMDERIRENHW